MGALLRVPILGNFLGFLRDVGNSAATQIGQPFAGLVTGVVGAFGRALVPPPAYWMGPEQGWGQPPPGTHFGPAERMPDPDRMAASPYGNPVGPGVRPVPGMGSPLPTDRPRTGWGRDRVTQVQTRWLLVHPGTPLALNRQE
jgi:hypothetical protein